MSNEDVPCRTLIAGFGRPGQRDLDFGRHLVSYLEQLQWPPGVVIEDLSYAAPLVLHRLQELRPEKVVLLGAVPRDDRPGTLRCRGVDPTPPRPEEVQRSLEESASGMVDIDHTLAVARHWGGLPVDTVVVEVEPADCSFGVGFSEDLAALFDPILAIARDKAGEAGSDKSLELDVADVADVPWSERGRTTCPPVGSGGWTGPLSLADQADEAVRRRQVRALDLSRGDPLAGVDASGVELAARSRPWGIGMRSGGDWCDVIPLGRGHLGVVMGDVAGRGVEATAVMSDLRAAVRAYAVLDGRAPARVLEHLDRLVEATGMPTMTTLLCLAVDPETGLVRLSNAGQCPPLVQDGGATRYVDDARGAPLGLHGSGTRPEVEFRLTPGSSLLLFTNGLVASRARSVSDGLDVLRRAATVGPDDVDALCDHVLQRCLSDMRRDDDICLMGLRLPAPIPAVGSAVRR